MTNRAILVLVATGSLLLSACGSSGTTASESVTVTEAPAETQAPAETEAPPETEVESGGPTVSISKSGFVTYEAIGETWATFGALVQNETDTDLFFVQVTYNVIGPDGSPVATESSYIDVLPAGDAIPAVGLSTTDLTAAMPVSVEVTAFAEEDSFLQTEWIELEVTAEPTVVADEFGFASVSGTVTNTSDVPAEFYSIRCLVTGPGGEILGGTEAYADTTAPGQTIAWEASGTGDFEAWAAAGATVEGCRSILTLT